MTERLVHDTTGTVLAEEVEWCRSALARAKGLIGRRRPPPALVLEPAAQVHTFFMRFGVDVVFCDRAWIVIHVASLGPWRMSRWVRGARRVVELPLGAAGRLRPGDVLRIEPYASDR
ncbi:MAG TPA: DUF192 domain-containing protein [Actinomycetota bacterium]|nr:DUF192 domain-containing protein [Actinomycetota bacterium]